MAGRSSFERFVLVLSDRVLPVAEVVARARVLAEAPERAEAAPLPLEQPHEERSLLLRKSSAR